MSLWDEAVESLKDKDKDNVDLQRTDKHAILADILEEIQKKKQACTERRLKYKRKNGEFVVLYDVYEKIVKWVNKFKEVGDIAVQYDPGHAALPWAAIRFFLQVSVNDVQTFGSLVEGLEVVCKTVARYAAIERLYYRQSSSVNNMLEDSIVATYASILRFLSKCRKYFGLGLAQRVARSITQLPETSVNKHLDRIAEDDKKVSELTRIVDAERSQLIHTQQVVARDGIDHLVHDLGELRMESTDSASKLEALLTDFKEPTIRTMNQVSKLSESFMESTNESQLKKERLEILKWVSNVQYKGHHQTLSKGLLEGTGSWLLNKREFVEWRDSSVSSVLWLHGIPGSGKTCLVATVVQQLLTEISTCENAAPIVYFYCQRNTAEAQRSDPAEVLRAILKQLVCCKARWESESPTAKEYRRRSDEANKDGSDIERLDIPETTQEIIEAVAEMPVTIIIDALDECRSGQRHELLGALDVLLEKSAYLVKIFVSSRDDVDIVLRLQKHPNIYINVYDNKHDINRFIQAEIQKAQSNGRLLKGTVSSELKTLVTESLAMKAGGMFLWVSLQIENLCDSRRIKIEGDLVDELAQLPRSLAGMYSLILKNIGQIEHRGRSVAETIFRWLLCTRDATSETTIAACSAIISTERRTLSVRDILDVCCNLVVFDKVMHRFRFAHVSVRDFLESQPGYTLSEADTCILEVLFQTLLGNQSSEQDPLGYYAIYTWVCHYDKLEEQDRRRVFELHARCFFFNGTGPSKAFNTWAFGVPWLRIFRLSQLPRPSRIVTYDNGDIETLAGPYPSIELVGDPLDLACYFGWLEVLDYYEMSQSCDHFRSSAVEIMTSAIRYGKTSVVRWPLTRNVRPTDQQLKLALTFEDTTALQIFSESDVLSATGLVDGQPILILAVRHDIRFLVRQLIDKGANIDCRDQTGRTPLFYAVSSHNLELVECLLQAGADPGAQDSCEETPLTLSIRRKKHIMSRLLLEKGSFTDPITRNGEDLQRLALHSHSMLEEDEVRAEWKAMLTSTVFLHDTHSKASASEEPGSRELPFHLFGHIVQDNMVSQTLLSLSAQLRHDEAFQLYLDLGVDPACRAICDPRGKSSNVPQTSHSKSMNEDVDDSGNSNSKEMIAELRQGPLAYAAFTGNLPLVKSILDRGVDPNLKNRKGQTALFFAVQDVQDKYYQSSLDAKKEAVVRLLLQRGALITTTDPHGGSDLLVHALEAGYHRVSKVLLENSAEPPAGAIDGAIKQLRGVFDQGQEGIRQTLMKRNGGARLNLLNLQAASATSQGGESNDTLDIAARLMYGGAMRILGGAVRTASGDTSSSI